MICDFLFNDMELVDLLNDLYNLVFDDMELVGFQSRVNAYFINPSCSLTILVFYFIFLCLPSMDWFYGAEVIGLIGYQSLSHH